MSNTSVAKLQKRLRHAKTLATWPGNPLVRIFGRVMTQVISTQINKAKTNS